ncbi:MAG: GDSL-type esterase/lipase family protein [Prevotellaceae bacterium]|jgi:lysophospholipase L1-like esterase|nr:GDSL-type esterase/lipase family protein [Prevotellaceae bacterium]
MRKTLITVFCSACFFCSAQQIKIACIGASITEGARIENPKENAYPGQLQALLGKNFKVENYGASGSTMLKNGNLPYWKTDAFQQALKSVPDVVFIDLGGNDAKSVNRPFYGELESDARAMILSFKNLPHKPRVILLLPTVSFEQDTSQIWDRMIKDEIIPRLQKAAMHENIEVLDMHSLLIDRKDLMPDGIHPELKGAEIIAKRLFRQLTVSFDEKFDIFQILKAKNIPYNTDSFAGYECASFKQKGRECKIVKPKRTASHRAWIWRARFWGHEAQTDIALLERGYHLVYCDQSERMGNGQCIDEWNLFYNMLTEAGLNRKAVLEGMSRGAVYAFNWAAANPDKVAAIYVDNPLLDMKAMYFDFDGNEKPENEITVGIKENYGVARTEIRSFKESPIDKIDSIVKGSYPILILCAELDNAAVNSQNTYPFEKSVREKGGDITVIEKKGFGHHPHSLPNPGVIVDFIENAVYRSSKTVDNYFPMQKRYDSYKGLAMAGYQGWFSCPGDGSDRGWYHYAGRNGLFQPGTCTIDMWPDVSEYDKIYKTSFTFADGSPAYVMSEYDASTVKTHFRWMREYGIDGVFVQRFVVEIKNPKSYGQLNKVWNSAINAANANNRAVCIMYDLSGMTPEDEQFALSDIDYITDKYDIKTRKNNPSYLYHNGKPLVAVWGVGFNDHRRYGYKEAETLIDELKKRGFSILTGVPTFWREGINDALDNVELHRLIRKSDIVMPWFVGRYDENSFPNFEKLVKDDIEWCRKNGVDYAPLAYPGFSWINMNRNSRPISRNRGNFYWKQLSSHIKNGAEMLYLAMFDEIDEGTAIFKCATETPSGDSYFLPLEKDLGNDYYLFLSGQASKMLRKEIPLTIDN